MVENLSSVWNRILSILSGWSVNGNDDRITAAEFEAKARAQGLVPIKVRKR